MVEKCKKGGENRGNLGKLGVLEQGDFEDSACGLGDSRFLRGL
jgi:hypothetical protein